jgi:hypothetical protein
VVQRNQFLNGRELAGVLHRDGVKRALAAERQNCQSARKTSQ